jgi:hypothetical protein
VICLPIFVILKKKLKAGQAPFFRDGGKGLFLCVYEKAKKGKRMFFDPSFP